ncbi:MULTISPECIES: efflux RND transporter periplasmic adaptor subunit [Pseudoxanthomonas]|uniref:Efflux RND transporter periplasmic adaptor subunit n=1 Tax=Pseudoxanthomonas winnipegensis TaxID=2480810 RepID=A0A4Q9TA85_9GAMM|nr:efflux RND transporter periplasmic adaptor subunit [Pseudoxanthomonas winnipegensis]MDQ1119425.1 multidrug efflux system membrane fusion protein [Pseudoxanthomonas winnipegensis]MDQ1132619.1 multidrug efflux system membrane fusion protein [Pseudoxanthomonas winnipegensis]RZZ90673.1 efflux RND transporter periplasmic adaptor subunit [Pseudoxanthomonas winnipegensis]TAA11184.1 efflux RND transporter periplasmic adaptor subunit [Pseudoxanthomonas winnipegensis]TAA18609.1 efflux RND transporter
MSRKWKIVLWTVVVVVVVVLGLRACGKRGSGDAEMRQGGQDSDKPVPVTVEPVTTQDVPVYRSTTGTVTALNTVTINPQTGGRLMSLDFTEGQPVKKGQLLARIDPRELQATYDQAAASRKQNLAQLQTARDTNARLTDPKYSQYVARTDLDTQKNLVAQYTAGVAAAEAQMQAAAVQLGYTRIVSPIDGIAGIRGVDVGNVVTTSSSIVTITQVEPIYASFSLPAQDLDVVRAAQARGNAPVAALDATDQHVIVADGVLDVVDNQVSADSNTFRLRARFPNADHVLWPGQFVNVRLQVDTLKQGMVVPTQAVQRGPDGDYVYALDSDNTVKMTPVTTGVEVGSTHIVVTKGLTAGQRVVTEGQFRLKPNAKVNPLKPGQAPPEPTAAELQQAMQGQRGGGRRGPPGR